MIREFFHSQSKDAPVDRIAMQDVELSDEQLKQVSGGYIVADQQGQFDWQKRQHYAYTHPGRAVPFLSFGGPSTENHNL